jgi:SAM-dependent methyltransferase
MRALIYLVTATAVLELVASLSVSATLSRSRFLSSSAAAFLTSAAVLALDPSPCPAIMDVANSNSNPRYVDRELEMKYAEDGDGNPRTRGMLVRRITGDSTPYSFPVKPVSLVKEWPEEPPFKPEDFFRADEIDDGSFYAVPRLVYHIDEPAVAALTQYYRKNIAAKSDILDICSSWVSHYPLEFKEKMKRISATGMSALELQFNDQLTDYQARNLNNDPKLPYEENSFDVVTCVVSIDYLIHPIEIIKEVHRVLRPGGKFIISQSNRCFPSKAIAMWLKMNDRQHLELINAYVPMQFCVRLYFWVKISHFSLNLCRYFQYAGGFQPRKAFDITAEVPGNPYNDPMFILEAEKI